MNTTSSDSCSLGTAKIILVVSVDAEANAIRNAIPDIDNSADLVVSGIGRVNAACATTEAILRNGASNCTAVINLGIAGAYENSGLNIGDVVVASTCVYAEEGIETPDGWANTDDGFGFPLGSFAGNTVPSDSALCKRIATLGRVDAVATVATCSGTDALAHLIAQRTRAVAEAMEGAAVVHASLRLGVPAVEVRVISNTTGDRAKQQWDIPRALSALGATTASLMKLMIT